MAEFPELTSFGPLFGFAVALEQNVAELARAAGELEVGDAGDALARSAKKHTKRARELENLRRERLNEVVLQPLTGMDRAEFLPPTELPTDPTAALATVAEADRVAATFYERAAELGGDVLMGVDKKFRKYAKQSRQFAESIEP